MAEVGAAFLRTLHVAMQFGLYLYEPPWVRCLACSLYGLSAFAGCLGIF